MTESIDEIVEARAISGGDLPTSRHGWLKLLDERGIRPSKGLGQNFLFDRDIVERIVRAADIEAGTTIVEIGPGLGILTVELLATADRVVAIEYDRRLAEHLRGHFAEHISTGRLTIIEADALLTATDTLVEPDEQFVVVANLPYSVGSAVVRHLFDQQHRPRRLVLMVQREVAERMVARVGQLSVLGVATQFYASPRIMFDVQPTVFIPPPTVVSSVIRLDVHAELPLPDDAISPFFKIVQAGFSQKRKQVANSIAARLGLSKGDVESWLQSAGVDADRRAQSLTVSDWVNITHMAPPLPEGDTSTTRRRDRLRTAT